MYVGMLNSCSALLAAHSHRHTDLVGLNKVEFLSHFNICHSKDALGPASSLAVILIARWNSIRVALSMQPEK